MAIETVVAVVVRVLVTLGHKEMLRVVRYALRDAATATASNARGTLLRFDLTGKDGKVATQVFVRVSSGYNANYGLGEGAYDAVTLTVGTKAVKGVDGKPATITDGVLYRWNEGRDAINTLLDNAPKRAGRVGGKDALYGQTD